MIESLRRTGEESLRQVRSQAEQEVQVLQAAATTRIDNLRRQCQEQIAEAEVRETRRALAEAEKRARELRLVAEKTLADSLFSIARFTLRRLRDKEYPVTFEKLVKELPPLDWRLVRVNSGDEDLGRTFFPEAELELVAHIAGGVDAALDDGAIRVINTLEKRLERAWDDLLPVLINDIYQEISHGTSAKAG